MRLSYVSPTLNEKSHDNTTLKLRGDVLSLWHLRFFDKCTALSSFARVSTATLLTMIRSTK